MKHQVKSFAVAFKGMQYCLVNEGHIRFHIIAGYFVMWFAFLCNFSIERIAILLLLIGAILCAEAVNTSIERLSNRVTSEYDRTIKIVKDVSSGAVLFLAVFAVFIAFLFFFDIEMISSTFMLVITTPVLLSTFIISVILAVIFGLFYPRFFRK